MADVTENKVHKVLLHLKFPVQDDQQLYIAVVIMETVMQFLWPK